jgi:hypothetical protein
MKIADFFARLGVDVNKEQWKEATGRITALKVAAAAMATYVATKAVGALSQLTKEAVGYGNALQDATAMTGIGAQAIEELGYAMGGGTDGLSKATAAFNKFGTSITSALKDPASDGAKALKAMGIALDDPRLKLGDIEAILPDLANGFEGMQNVTERNAVAMALFGKSGFEVGKTLAELNDKRKEFAEAGGALTEAERKALAGTKGAADQTIRMWQLLKTKAIAGIAPQLNEMMSKVVKFVSTNRAAISAFISDLVGALSVVASSLVDVFGVVAEWIRENKDYIGATWAALTAAFQMLILLVKHFGLLVLKVINAIIWVFKLLWDIVAGGYAIVKAVFGFMVDLAKAFWTFLKAIPTTIMAIFGALAELGAVLAAPFIGAFELVTKAWDAVYSGIAAAWETVKGWIDEIQDAVSLVSGGKTAGIERQSAAIAATDKKRALSTATKLFQQGKTPEEIQSTLSKIYSSDVASTAVRGAQQQIVNTGPVSVTIQGNATPETAQQIKQAIQEANDQLIRNAAVALVQ